MSTRYEIWVEGVLDKAWSSWFDGMDVTSDERATVMTGSVADQAALHGLLWKIHDRGSVLVSLRRLNREDLMSDASGREDREEGSV
jgi:hypothetical protein